MLWCLRVVDYMFGKGDCGIPSRSAGEGARERPGKLGDEVTID